MCVFTYSAHCTCLSKFLWNACSASQNHYLYITARPNKFLLVHTPIHISCQDAKGCLIKKRLTAVAIQMNQTEIPRSPHPWLCSWELQLKNIWRGSVTHPCDKHVGLILRRSMPVSIWSAVAACQVKHFIHALIKSWGSQTQDAMTVTNINIQLGEKH